MENIDMIYDLIQKDNSINTLNNNLELFQNFFYHDMSIHYNGLKVIDIYKYILSLNLEDDNEQFPYINSNIMEDFNMFIMSVTQRVYSKDFVANDEYIDLIYTMISTYYEFKKYNNTKLTHLEEENQFIRDYTGAMIILLNSSFFDISTDNVLKMMASIKNNDYLKSIIESGKIGNQLLDKEYLFDYTSRFLFTAECINEENISNDELINAIKQGYIKDIDTLKRIFKYTNIFFLEILLKDGVSSLVDLLDNITDDITIKKELFNIVEAKLRSDYITMILDFIMKDERSNIYYDEKEKYNVISKISMSAPNNLTSEEILYVLKNCDRSFLKLFVNNLVENLKRNNWSEEIRNFVENAKNSMPSYEYDFETAIKDLDTFFKDEEIEMDYFKMFAIIKCLIKNILNDDTLVFFVHSNEFSGYASKTKNIIGVNQKLIFDICKSKNIDDNPQILDIFITIYHEARHIIQYKLTNGDMDEEIYKQYKETIFRCVSEGYYQKNYHGITYERDARIASVEGVLNLLKTYFPYLENCIRYYEKELEKEQQDVVEDKYFFELSKGKKIDEIMDKLLLVNPDIIKRYEGLLKEYNLDGTRITSNNVR